MPIVQTDHRIFGDGFGSKDTAIPIGIWGRSDEPVHLRVGSDPVQATVGVTALPAVSASVTSLPAVSVGVTAIPSISAGVTSIPPVSVGVTALPAVQANVGGTTVPIKVNLGSVTLEPGITLTFNLFGFWFLPLLSIKVRGNASIGS
jgi:hypothetical protein